MVRRMHLVRTTILRCLIVRSPMRQKNGLQGGGRRIHILPGEFTTDTRGWIVRVSLEIVWDLDHIIVRSRYLIYVSRSRRIRPGKEIFCFIQTLLGAGIW